MDNHHTQQAAVAAEKSDNEPNDAPRHASKRRRVNLQGASLTTSTTSTPSKHQYQHHQHQHHQSCPTRLAERFERELVLRVEQERSSNPSSWNERQHLLAVLRFGGQVRRDNALFDTHLRPVLERHIADHGLAPVPDDAALYGHVEAVGMQEKCDPVLNRAYLSTMKQSGDSLREAEHLLLSILPESVGGELLDIWTTNGGNSGSSNGSSSNNGSSNGSNKQAGMEQEQRRRNVRYYDVEQPLELLMLRQEAQQQRESQQESQQESQDESQEASGDLILATPISHHSAMHLFVYLLIEQREFARALEVCQIALRRNPLFTHCLFETGEIYKMLKRPEELYTVTMTCFHRCYKQKDIAKCYRNFGFYYIEKKNYELSVACFLKSLEYEVHPMVKNELNYIQQKIAQNDRLYVATQSIMRNLLALEQRQSQDKKEKQQQQQQQQQVHGYSTIQTVHLNADVLSGINESLEHAKIPIAPNPRFVKCCHELAVQHRGNQKRFLEACTLAYGLTLNTSYLAYIRTYLSGTAEVCGFSPKPRTEAAANVEPLHQESYKAQPSSPPVDDSQDSCPATKENERIEISQQL